MALIRKTYDRLKKRGLHTKQVFRILQGAGFTFSQRTLQNYLDDEFLTCKDDDIKKAITGIIKNYDELVANLKKEFT